MHDRRQFLASAAAFGLAGATGTARAQSVPDYDVPPEHMPQVVFLPGRVTPYEIDVVPDEFALYWTLPDNQAIRYTVGIGRPGLYQPGNFYVGARKEWPSWTPTPDMIEREPELYKKHEDGMDGGLSNPLGARALYLFKPGKGDTFLRIHGTDDPSTIGVAVSNGCARLVNDQMVELYDRVPLGTVIRLHPKTTLPAL